MKHFAALALLTACDGDPTTRAHLADAELRMAIDPVTGQGSLVGRFSGTDPDGTAFTIRASFMNDAGELLHPSSEVNRDAGDVILGHDDIEGMTEFDARISVCCYEEIRDLGATQTTVWLLARGPDESLKSNSLTLPFTYDGALPPPLDP